MHNPVLPIPNTNRPQVSTLTAFPTASQLPAPTNPPRTTTTRTRKMCKEAKTSYSCCPQHYTIHITYCELAAGAGLPLRLGADDSFAREDSSIGISISPDGGGGSGPPVGDSASAAGSDVDDLSRLAGSQELALALASGCHWFEYVSIDHEGACQGCHAERTMRGKWRLQAASVNCCCFM